MAYDKFGDAGCLNLVSSLIFFFHSQTEIILGKECVLFNLLTVSSDLQQPVEGN